MGEDNAKHICGQHSASQTELAGNFLVHSSSGFRDISMAQMVSKACRRKENTAKSCHTQLEDNSLRLEWYKGND